MKRAGKNIATLVMVLLLALTVACAPLPEEVTSPLTPAVERGIIEIRVTDPPPADVISANVTAENIEIHRVVGEEGEWIIIIPGPVTFDLVKLAEEEEAEILGVEEITTGSFTQIRMEVTELEVTIEGYPDPISAEVPSDKLKIVRPFNVEGGVKTILTLDFDGDKSLVMTGEGKFLFKPVVKLLIEYEAALAPTVTTIAATDITTTSASLNGSLDDLGSFTSVDVSFEWGTETGVYPYETTPEEMTETGAFSAALTDLLPNTTYYFRAKAEAHGIISYGDELSFTTFLEE